MVGGTHSILSAEVRSKQFTSLSLSLSLSLSAKSSHSKTMKPDNIKQNGFRQINGNDNRIHLISKIIIRYVRIVRSTSMGNIHKIAFCQHSLPATGWGGVDHGRGVGHQGELGKCEVLKRMMKLL